jgi:hypothetical protein
MADNNKSILLLGGLVAAIGGAYLYFKNACAQPAVAGASWPPASVCAWSIFAPTAVATAPPGTGAGATQASCVAGGGTWNGTACIPPAPPAPPANPPAASSDPWANAIALMKHNAPAGLVSDLQNFDQWAWQFQYQPRPASPTLPTGYGNNGYITPAIMDTIINLGGGDRSKLISAETFVGYLRTALSQAGLSGFELPSWMFHRGMVG